MVLTRKIQLHVHASDAEVIQNHYQTLYRWRYIVFRALNMVTSHLFVQEQLKDFFYFTQDFHLKLTDQLADGAGVLNTSKLNATNRLLSKIFKGEIPNDILCCLNYSLSSVFSKEVKSYRSGEKSLRSYQRKQPLPFKGRSVKQLKPEGQEYTFNLFKIPFRTYLGKDRQKRILLNSVFHRKTKLCNSSIVLDKGKIFWLASFEMNNSPLELDHGVIAEASLSINHPVTIDIDQEHYLIGNKEEFLHRRLAIQAARQRLQKGSSFNHGGHGRKRKTKAVAHVEGLEERYVNHKLHLYSKRLIDICLKAKAATLILVNQKAREEIAREDEFLLQNWSYFGLKEKIMYKAAQVGILVVVE
ncbi:MAG: transposase [Pedobacter sp.]|nr:MAG: transposase [Pedobacter sp.]